MNHTPVIRIVDDDRDLLESLRACLSTFAWRIETYESAEAFLAGTDFAAPGCLILDVAMPGMKGPELQLELKRRGVEMPIIFLSGHGTIAMAVAAMARGAATFLEKPVEPQKLREAVVLAMSKLITIERETSVARDARARFETLTEREKGNRAPHHEEPSQQDDRRQARHFGDDSEDASRQHLCQARRQKRRGAHEAPRPC